MSAGANRLGKGMFQKGASSGHWAFMMVLFSTTIFVSAALLFLVEPMFAKFVLPSFGGTPAVWTGSMMFFQAALLTSYLYVHATTSWLGARRQAVLHLGVVLLPLLLFVLAGPIDVPAEDWAPPAESNPLFWLLGLLLVSIGLPFFVISATNPLIQRWLVDTDHPSARDPYFLYRASNLGSVIGLLGYPLVVERELTLANQGIVWTVGYGFLVVLVFASAVVLWRSAPAPETTQEEEEPLSGDPISGGGSSQADPSLTSGLQSSPTFLRRLRWIGLAFVPSSLMLGVTAFITTDITPIPLLWVLPLSLYLFSFIVVFSTNQRMPDLIHKVMVAALPVVMALLVVTSLTGIRSPYWALILLHLFGFFVVAMVLHGELARDRPPARNLTEFYLWVSVGGVLGGVFNALIAPVVFNTVVEYSLAIVLACLFVPGTVLAQLLRRRSRQEEERDQEGSEEEEARDRSEEGRSRNPRLARILDFALPVALGVVVYALGVGVDSINPSPEWVISFFGENWRTFLWQTAIGLAAGLCLYFAYVDNRSIRFGLGIAALIVAATIATGAGSILFEDRSFFGLYKVSQDSENPAYRALVVGNTNHGAQIVGPVPPEPIAYQERTGPFGQLFDTLPEETTDESPLAVLGLGPGTMACYTEPGQQMTFYEIDPMVERMARDPNLFTYLRDCQGEFDVTIGDARIKMNDVPDGSYGMVVAEAFNSDAIPVHLLTREALELYLQKLNDTGVMVFNIANRYVDLEPVLGNLAQDLGLLCYSQFDANAEENPNKLASQYAVLAREEADLGGVPDDGRWQPCTTNASGVWTDDFSNLLGTFVFN